MFNTQPQPSFSSTSRGFSLIETLVAISVLLTVTSSIMALVNQSIDSSEALSNRLAASYLASDAIEYLRYSRDSYWLNASSNSFDDWITNVGLDNCTNQCLIDTRVGDIGANNNNRIRECTNCGPLKYNDSEKRYGYDSASGWEDSKFIRNLKLISQKDLESGSSGIDEVLVKVTMKWPNRSGATSTLMLRDTLTAWGD